MTTLYVFYVNRGFLVPVDYEVGVRTVSHLKSAIAEAINVACDDQVLLSSSGATMEAEKRVAHYSEIGSASRPVFLFSRSMRHDKEELMTTSQHALETLGKIDELIGDGEASLAAPRLQLFQILPEHLRRCNEIAEQILQTAARIVEEHQLLQMGWMALVANFEETVARLEKRSRNYESNIGKLEVLREKAEKLFAGFDESVNHLKNIKMPSSLLPSKAKKEMTFFEWISSSDPNHSLHDLVDEVTAQLREFVGMEGGSHIRDVVRQLRQTTSNADNREIKGINKRIQQLEHKLVSMNEAKSKIAEDASLIALPPVRHDEAYLRSLADEASARVRRMHVGLAEMRKHAELFFKSKKELLNNVRIRLTGWVVTAYERLHFAHMNIVAFEEKFKGLRQRLDLVRQVKEAPLMFATCITEVLRRSALYKEFRAWHQAHLERCLTFSSEENQLRTVFATKLEKHFVRVCFQGIFDQLPVFYVKHIPDFDQQLPPIDMEYYRELRKSIGALESVLKVASPQVIARLSLRPASFPSCSSSSHLRRDESYISFEQAPNITNNLHNAFPSTAWLLDEGMDMSPNTEPALLMNKSPAVAGAAPPPGSPFVPGNRLPSLHDIHETVPEGEREVQGLDSMSQQMASSYKTQPIQIPLRGGDSHVPESSHFSTPEDHFQVSGGKDEQQFTIDDISTRSQMLEVLRPVAEELNKLNKDLGDTRAELVVYKERLDLDIQLTVSGAAKKFVDHLESCKQEYNKEAQRLRNRLAEMERAQSFLEQQLSGKNGEIELLNQQLTEKDSKIEGLEADVATIADRVKEAEQEVFKKLTIENELEKDRIENENQHVIDEKDETIRGLQRDIERKAVEIEKLKKGPTSEEYHKVVVADTRAELEKEFKARIELIAKGIEQKKEEGISRIKKDIEFDFKRKATEQELSMKMLTLERDLLRDALDDPDAMLRSTVDIAEHVQKEANAASEEKRLAPYTVSTPKPSPRKALSPVDDPLPPLHVFCENAAQTEECGVPKVILPGMSSQIQLLPSEGVMGEEKADTGDSDSSIRKDSSDSGDDKEKTAEKRRWPEQATREGRKLLMQQSAMEQSAYPAMEQSILDDASCPEEADQKVERGGLISQAAQTRLQSRAMDYMVSLNDIREGMTVLVVWDDRHNSYILFCISNYIHFVKETSVRRLGLVASTEAGELSARKNWVLARVVHVDLCVIKKPSNRYKLPIDTKVYRVDVAPVTIDPTTIRTTTVTATS